jgi:DNA-binding XRE family transcriptional regulator
MSPTVSYKKQYGLKDHAFFFASNYAQTTSFLGVKAESVETATLPILIPAGPAQQCLRMVIVGHKIKLDRYCEKDTDINDYIADLTATDRGRRLWREASAEFEVELWQKVASGKMSKIKYYRIIKNIDQKTLAKLTGLLQPNISRLEKPGVKPSIENYKKIAKALEMDYKELLP